MNGDLPSLDLAVVTHRPEGIERVARMVLPPVEGVRYVVSWQDSRGASVPDSLAARPDVEIYRFEGKGISANRNNAFDHCRSDIVLFSDDDLIYNKEGLMRLREVYKENPTLDLATLQSQHGDPSRFPAGETRLTVNYPAGYSVCSIEISFRRKSLGALRLCPELGLGAPKLGAGEDEMFLLSAIKRGKDCRFFPITVCSHPADSTGSKRRLSRAYLRASGCVIALSYPLTSFLRIPLKAWRLSRSGRSGFFRALGSLTRGATMAPGLLRRNHDTLW